MYAALLTSGLITRSRRVRARSRTLGLPWYEAGDGVVIVESVIVPWVWWWSIDRVPTLPDILATCTILADWGLRVDWSCGELSALSVEIGDDV